MEKEVHSGGSHPEVFRTGFGLPLYLSVPPFVLGVINGILLQSVLFQVTSAAMLMILVYFMLSTKYRVQDGVLDVRMGPFSRCIDLESISAIFLNGKAFGSRCYGLDTDLVGIDYEGGSVSITPKDVDGFLAAIGVRLTQSGDVERSVRPSRA